MCPLSLKRPSQKSGIKNFRKLFSSRGTNWFSVLVVLVAALIGFNAVLYHLNRGAMEGNYLEDRHKVPKPAAHLQKPMEVRGIYITAYTASIARLDELITFIKNNGLNTAVVDIKTPRGEPAFTLKDETLKKYNLTNSIYSPEEIIAKLHFNDIYVIGRTAVFQDSYLAKKEPRLALQWKTGGAWQDWKGAAWLDPTAFGVWRYNVTLAREAWSRGFDEINFDYIRFPTDGNIDAIKYTNWSGATKKEEEIEKFFSYVSRIMRKLQIPISADLFGLVCCRDNDDMGIGQRLERALPYFDYISPMMYPSHYEKGFNDYGNPASHPYGVVKYSMQKANGKIERLSASSTAALAKIRPWIQDFDLGAEYDAVKVRAQIHAVQETGGEGFLIWNARNIYTAIE